MWALPSCLMTSLKGIEDQLDNLQKTYENIRPDMIRIAGNGADLGNSFLNIFKPLMTIEGFNGIFPSRTA